MFAPLVSRRAVLVGGGALGATVALGNPRLGQASERPPLPIITELRADQKGEIALRASPGRRSFIGGVDTKTAGFNGDFLGPALRVRRGDDVLVRVNNGLADDTTVHWHGLKIPGEVDGGPYNVIKPGADWTAKLSIEQAAATCWYHPHIYPATAEQVILGLAGLLVINDEESDALGLPSRWGVDDIAVVLQDRRFNADGSFFHRFNLAAVTAGYVGDTMLVNGAVYPQARTAKGWLRLRILNGSNARSYRLAIPGRSFFVVASDGGLLGEPAELTELVMFPGERYEVLVDARDGQRFDLVTLPVGQLAMALPPFDKPLALVTFVPDGVDGTGGLPDSLVELPPLVPDLPAARQNLLMGMRLDKEGMALFKDAGWAEMVKSGKTDPAVVERINALITQEPALALEQQLGANTVNGQSFELGAVPYATTANQDERWVITEGTDLMAHPVHIHGCQFRLIAFNGKPPPAHMAGWKDIALIEKGGSCEIQVRFEHPAPAERPFMAHCHILEHEDSGMMTDFTVS